MTQPTNQPIDSYDAQRIVSPAQPAIGALSALKLWEWQDKP